MISGVLTVVLVFSALMLGGFTGAWAIWPTAYRHGYAEGEQDRHRHRAGHRQETTLLQLPRAGRLEPVAVRWDSAPDRGVAPHPSNASDASGDRPLAHLSPAAPPWLFAGGWDQGPVAEPAELELLTATAEQPVAGVDTPSDFIEGMTETVNAMISEWVAQGNVDRHTIRASDG